MKNYVFSTYDSKSEIFHTPMFLKTRAEAIRAFSDEANRPDSAIFKHPGDYTLFCLGEFDLESGLITPLTTPSSLGLAIEYQQKQEQMELNPKLVQPGQE